MMAEAPADPKAWWSPHAESWAPKPAIGVGHGGQLWDVGLLECCFAGAVVGGLVLVPTSWLPKVAP